MEMTSRCQSMSLVEVREGICLCSKLLSRVMPSMKPVERRTQSSMSVAGSVASEKAAERYASNHGNHGYHSNHGNHSNHISLSNQNESLAPYNTYKQFTSSTDSSSLSITDDSIYDSIIRDESYSSSTETGSSPTRETSNGRLVHVARISTGEDGWSVVDLRKRLETGASSVGEQPSYDESESTETDDDDDEIIDNKNILKTEGKAMKKGESKEKDPNKEITEEADQDDYEEWMECQESIDVSQDCVTKEERVTREDSVINDGEFGDQASTPGSPNRSFQPSVIQSCIDYFQSFFSEFVNNRIISSSSNVSEFRQTIKSNSEYFLDELLSLEKCSDNKESTANEKKDSSDMDKEKRLDKRLPWEQESSLMCAEAFAAACRLLVELSCFPVYCTSDLVTGDQKDGEWCLC